MFIIFTKNIYICQDIELKRINDTLKNKFNLMIEVVTQEEETILTAKGCYRNIDYDGPICIFIGGGGSIELIFVENREIFGQKFYDFGVVEYINTILETPEYKANVIILAGGDHLYWFNNALYEMDENTLYLICKMVLKIDLRVKIKIIAPLL